MSPGLSVGVTADSFSPLKTLHVSLFRLKTACLMCRVSSRTGDLTLHSDTRWSEASGRSYMEANWQTQDQSVLSIRRNCGTLAPGCQPVSSLCVCVCDADSECVCWSVAFNDTVLADYNRHEGRSCVGEKSAVMRSLSQLVCGIWRHLLSLCHLQAC